MAFYGTGFEPLKKDEDLSAKPEEDLTVRDEKGRRRFHGAFTGGFSAGHFNTVGTVEGWVPRQFKSTRVERQDRGLLQQKPEDYMDEEDLGLFGIAPKRVRTTDDFTSSDGGQFEGFAGFRGANTSTSISDYLRGTVVISRESIGRKLYKSMKRALKKAPHQSYGCEPSVEIETKRNKHLQYSGTADRHGLGFRHTEQLLGNESVSNSLSARIDGRRLEIRGEAFGTGALDDDDEYDHAVYSHDSMVQYDFDLSVGRQKSNDKKSKVPLLAITGSHLNFLPSRRKYSIGGKSKEKFTINVPQGWRPNPVKSLSKQINRKISRWDTKIGDQGAIKEQPVLLREWVASRKRHNANSRSILFGEGVEQVEAVKTVKPNPAKQQPTAIKKTTLETDKRERETRDEFNKNFVNRPLEGFWASKFVRGSEPVQNNKIMPGLSSQSEMMELVADDVGGGSEEAPTLQPGSVKRTCYEWHPHNLLCKRFNVPNPYPNFPDVTGVVTAGITSETIINRVCKATTTKNQTKTEICEQSARQTTKENSPELQNSPGEVAIHDSLAITQRPPQELFHAIFASDQESDSDEEEEEDDKEPQENKRILGPAMPPIGFLPSIEPEDSVEPSASLDTIDEKEKVSTPHNDMKTDLMTTERGYPVTLREPPEDNSERQLTRPESCKSSDGEKKPKKNREHADESSHKSVKSDHKSKRHKRDKDRDKVKDRKHKREKGEKTHRKHHKKSHKHHKSHSRRRSRSR